MKTTISELLKDALSKMNESESDIIALSVRDYDDEKPAITVHEKKDAISWELSNELEPYSRINEIPLFCVWTDKYVYMSHKSIHYNDDYGNEYKYDIVVTSRNPEDIKMEIVEAWS